jgi:hypothetical protein
MKYIKLYEENGKPKTIKQQKVDIGKKINILKNPMIHSLLKEFLLECKKHNKILTVEEMYDIYANEYDKLVAQENS